MNKPQTIARAMRAQQDVVGLPRWARLLLFICVTMLWACGGDDDKTPSPTDAGEILIRVNGLEGGAAANIRLIRPDGESDLYSVPHSHLVTPLPVGEYTAEASNVPGYNLVSASSVLVDVRAGRMSEAAFSYEPAALWLQIEQQPVRLGMNQATNLKIMIHRAEGFDGAVTLRVDDLENVRVTPQDVHVNAQDQSAELTLTDDGAALGEHILTVRAEGTHNGKKIEAELDVPLEIAAVVTSTLDAGEGSLRAVLADPRTAGHTVIFDKDAFSTAQTVLVEQVIEIDAPVTIVGPAVDPEDLIFNVRLDGQDASQIFRIAKDVQGVVLQNLEFANGRADRGAAIEIAESAEVKIQNCRFHNHHGDTTGGAIYTYGDLTIEDSVFTDNTAGTRGGALFVLAGETTITNGLFRFNEAGDRGGAVAAHQGTLIIQGQSRFQDNHASHGGAVMVGQGGFPLDRDTLHIEDSLFRGNTATNGGAIVNYWSATILHSVIQDNVASRDGGGIRNHQRMDISSSSILGNQANERYGGVFNDGLMTIEDSVLRDNHAATDGGGVFHGYFASDTIEGRPKELIIERTEIADNTAGRDGGGIYSIRRMQISDSWVHDNHALRNGGGIFTATIPHDATLQDGGTIEIRNTTISDNQADIQGGGVYSSTLPSQSGSTATPKAPFHMLNSTVAQNMAGAGGGLYISGANDAVSTIYFSTIVQNIARTTQPPAGVGGGGVVQGRSAPLELRGNILTDNIDEVNGPNDSQDLMRLGTMPVTSRGYNILGSDPLWATLHAEDLVNRSGLVASLDAHDDLVPTMDLIASQFFDWVPTASCTLPNDDPLTHDQRAASRPQGAGCSPGAVER